MIQPEFKSLNNVLNGKLFCIPEYQRHYSWETKQRNDLFNDIEKIYQMQKTSADSIHFMATVVCLNTKQKKDVGSDSFVLYDVVDGQQRLTSLIILLKAIAVKLKDQGSDKEYENLNQLLTKEDGRLIILQNNHDNRNILRNYLEKGLKPKKDDIKTQADENLFYAIKESESFASTWGSELIKILQTVKNSLYFIFQTLEDKRAVYTIFEVLNSRGLEVDWLDKCKSMLMGLLYECTLDSVGNELFLQHLNELQRYWSEIYSAIGLLNIQGHEIIRFAATLKSSSDSGSPLNAEESIQYFKEHCISSGTNNEKINRIIEDTLWIKEVTTCLSKLYADKRRNAVTGVSQARLLATAIILRNDLTDAEKTKILEQWERTSFRIYGLFGKDSRTKRGDFVRLSKKIQKESNLTSKDIIKLIAEISSEYPIEGAIDLMRYSDCYNGWQHELRYLFYRYEEYLSKTKKTNVDEAVWNSIWKSNTNNTIEHILPQTIEGSACWKIFKVKEHEKLLNTLGNLVLLSPGLNSEALNHCFDEKKDVYRRANTILAMQPVLQCNEWNKDEITNRTEVLLKFIKEQWSDI